MRGGLYRRLIHLSLLVILIRLAGRSGSALPYRLPWPIPRATFSGCSVCAWVCCNPQIAHRDKRSLSLAGFTGFAQCDGNRLLAAFDLRAFAGTWLAGLQRAALVLTHHLGDLGLGFGWLFHVPSLSAHTACVIAPASALSRHHGQVLPWRLVRRTY